MRTCIHPFSQPHTHTHTLIEIQAPLPPTRIFFLYCTGQAETHTSPSPCLFGGKLHSNVWHHFWAAPVTKVMGFFFSHTRIEPKKGMHHRGLPCPWLEGIRVVPLHCLCLFIWNDYKEWFPLSKCIFAADVPMCCPVLQCCRILQHFIHYIHAASPLLQLWKIKQYTENW